MNNDNNLDNLHLKSIKMQELSLQMQAAALDTQRDHMAADHDGTEKQNQLLERIAVALEKLAKS